MNLNILSVAESAAFYSEKFAPGSTEAVNKALTYGLPFSLFGFAVVFAVLAVLMLIVIAFGKIFAAPGAETKASPKHPEKKAEVKVESTPVVEVAPVVADNGGIVAAIMAAISAFRSANGEGGSFRVVSFKKRK